MLLLTFNKKYFRLTLLLFFVEVFIAVFIKDTFIRPFIGDVLVVILIYCLVKAFWNIHSSIAALFILAFACTMEILQYFNFVSILGLQNNRILAIALGSTFDWNDITAYTLGTAIVLWLENRPSRKSR
ncbi:DUF2809 domain-containing protein [Chamaesiphon sp. VAR_48_metabat_135_sub]|uniref:ribosomal maturation YjgA family protein n=1 Tax=Chamaesiphon sp. VAR_48_metabat_135_sub TaxID=2964699 RepID=UPI00286A0451|nr:DUF2809 domain-containing protein [Chamaesiphon sp. VAR_48_metabat_135_sub]